MLGLTCSGHKKKFGIVDGEKDRFGENGAGERNRGDRISVFPIDRP